MVVGGCGASPGSSDRQARGTCEEVGCRGHDDFRRGKHAGVVRHQSGDRGDHGDARRGLHHRGALPQRFPMPLHQVDRREPGQEQQPTQGERRSRIQFIESLR